jgi:hypothetical protein
MRFRTLAALLATCVAAAVVACNGQRPAFLAPAYEYEEDLTLSLDGSASMVVNASLPALATLRGLSIAGDLTSRVDTVKSQAAALYASPYTTVTRVSVWTRNNRRFVGVHLDIPNIRDLPKAAPFAWSTYELTKTADAVSYSDTLSTAGENPAAARPAGFTGSELIAFRLHLPARIRFHNVRDLVTGATRNPGRGNILTWEQTLGDRLAGKPIAWSDDHRPNVMEARMDSQSILYRTVWLFAFAFLAALLLLGGVIWFAVRRGGAEDEREVAGKSPPQRH